MRMTSKSKMFLVLLVFGLLSAQDSVKVSIPALDKEIREREQAQISLQNDIQGLQNKAIYLQGAIDMLKLKRDEYKAQADTTGKK